jgi:transposase
MNESGQVSAFVDGASSGRTETKGHAEGDNAAAVARDRRRDEGVFQEIPRHRSRGAAVRVQPAQRARLEALTRGRSQPHRVVVRSRIVLRAADGVPLAAIAREVRVARSTVRRWCRRFVEGGVAALLAEAPGRGRRPGIERGVVLSVLHTMRSHAGAATSVRALATGTGTSVTRVWRILTRLGLRTTSTCEAIDAAIERVISETRERS